MVSRPGGDTARFSSSELQRAEEVQQVLFVGGSLVVVLGDHPGGLASVGGYGLDQVHGSPVVEEEEALSESPEGGGAEFGKARITLGDAVGQGRSHVVHQQIRVEERVFVGQG